jgi:type IV secretory pathway TraG/TraD family ATPase VirD4
MLIPDAFDGLSCPKFLHDPRALPQRPRRDPASTHGAARIADRREIEYWFDHATPQPHSTRLPYVSPIVEGRRGLEVRWSRTMFLPEPERNRHILIVSQPGGGKTQNFILPFLHSDIGDRERSLVVLDPKGEILPFVQAAAARLRPGTRVQVLNLTDAAVSIGWNPLAQLQQLREQTGSDLSSRTHELASTLCWASELRRQSNDSVFFLNRSIELISGLCEGLAEGLGSVASLGHVFELLQGPRADLNAFAHSFRHTQGLSAFTHFLASGSHNAETVLADAQMRMTVWRDRTVRAITGRDELCLRHLVEQPTILVIQMREADLERLRPLVNLLFTSLLQMLMREASERPDTHLPRPVSLVIDEFASAVGRIPGFESSVNTLRGPRVSILAAVQSLGQIRHLYGEAHESVLAGFNTKIFQPGLESIDAEYASQKAGVMSALSQSVSQPELLEHPEAWRYLQRHMNCVPRRLFHPEEIARPPRHFDRGQAATVFLPSTNPFQAWFLPAWRNPECAQLLREGQKPAMRSAPRRPQGSHVWIDMLRRDEYRRLFLAPGTLVPRPPPAAVNPPKSVPSPAPNSSHAQPPQAQPPQAQPPSAQPPSAQPPSAQPPQAQRDTPKQRQPRRKPRRKPEPPDPDDLPF